MSKNPLDVLVENDKKLIDNIMKSKDLAFAEGALSSKVKILMAMALDASLGTSNGVRSLAIQAMEAGATKDEILETIRVASFVSGAHSVFTAAVGLDGLI